MRISRSFTIPLSLTAAALSTASAFGQCLAQYQTIAGADAIPSATYWACDLDDDTSELAVLGQGGRVFVGALDSVTQKWAAAPTELPVMNSPFGGAPSTGTLALDGDYLVVSLRFTQAGVGFTAPGHVAIYHRNSVGAWTGPVTLDGMAQYESSPGSPGGLIGARTDWFGNDLELLDQGGTAHVLIGDPSVRPPTSMAQGPHFTDGAVFSAQVSTSGGIVFAQRVYRPQWGTGTPPSQQARAGNFGSSLDLSVSGNRLAVGAPAVGFNAMGSATRTGSAFTYTVSKNVAGEVVELIPEQTSGLGVVTIPQAEDGLRIGTHVAMNDSWLLASSGPFTSNPQTRLFSAGGANGWTMNQIIPVTIRAVMSDTHIIGSAGYAAVFSGSNVVPITGQGDQPTVSGTSFSVNNSVAVAATSGNVGIWRTDCSGDLLCYSGVVDSYCSATNNSTGAPAVTSAMGSYLASDNDMTLRVTGAPQNESGYFLVSGSQAFIPGPGGSAGNLCLGSPMGRYNQQVQNSGLSGSFDLTIDLTVLPMNPLTPVFSGDTYHFQAWTRDGNTSNFSLPFMVTFQ